MTVKKSRRLSAALPPVGAVSNHKKAYADALDVIGKLNDEIDRLADMVDWAVPRMKDELTRASLVSMKNDPHKMPITEKKVSRENPASGSRVVVSITENQDAPSLPEGLPPETARFLAETPEDEMNWVGDNFDHMATLRAKGFFILVGADNQVGFPPKLSRLGIAAKTLIIEQNKGKLP